MGGGINHSQMVVVALGLLGLPHLSNLKWKKLGTQSLGGDLGMVWPSLAEAAGHGIPSRTSWHPFGPARIFVHCRPKQRRNEASESC